MSASKNSEKENMTSNRNKRSICRFRRKIRKYSTGYIFVVGLLTVISIATGVRVGSNAASNSYENAFNTEKEETYSKYYDQAEKKYHVSNEIKISIGRLMETSKLEVLRVSDVEYAISNDDEYGITSWLEVPGSGTYVVNLQEAEYIIDDERDHVLVRVPYPEITNITIDYANVNKLLFKNNLLNDSIKVGEDLARRQLSSADMLIKKEFASNESFYKNAQEAARSTIQCMVKQLNPEIANLEVDVEFF